MSIKPIEPFFLDPDDSSYAFPPVELAMEEPNGLLAVGGDLTTARLLSAYKHGIFPWFNPSDPILWWCPNPRSVIFPRRIKISRSLSKSIRNKDYKVTVNQAFDDVVKSCAAPRDEDEGTWISPEMHAAYGHLHQLGHAHSIEVWLDKALVGGLYGVLSNNTFSGESMFSHRTDASKTALVALAYHCMLWNITLIDCQISNPFLVSMGAEDMSRRDFMQILRSQNVGVHSAFSKIDIGYQLWQP